MEEIVVSFRAVKIEKIVVSFRAPKVEQKSWYPLGHQKWKNCGDVNMEKSWYPLGHQKWNK